MDDTEQSVLRHYQKVNPSKMTPAFQVLLKKRQRLFQEKLHLPLRMFQGAKLLDLGCGTGEHSATYAAWGASVTGIDFNGEALDHLVHFVERHGLSSRLEAVQRLAVSDWNPEGVFDIAISDGLLNHLKDARQGFSKLVASLKPGGFLVFSIGTTPGSEQRALMRRLVRTLTRDLSEAMDLAWRWFPEYMERAVRIGGRTPEQVVSDTFTNPQVDPLPLGEVLRWLEESALLLYRTWPSLDPNIVCPGGNDLPSWHQNLPQMLKRAQSWTAAGGLGDEDGRLRQWDEEDGTIADLLIKHNLQGLDAYIPTCTVFGRGSCGIGEAWFVGVKPESTELLP